MKKLPKAKRLRLAAKHKKRHKDRPNFGQYAWDEEEKHGPKQRNNERRL